MSRRRGTATERSRLSPEHRRDGARQHTVLYRAGETRQQWERWRVAQADQVPASNSGGAISSYATPPRPSVQELRELLELKQELTQMYQQQQKTQITQTPADQQ